MSYRINRTDGELIIDLIDGVIDTTSTDITLIGRNYKGFGEWINENFIKLLENFASTEQPPFPLTGQLWYDKSDLRLKVFDGTTFRSATGTILNSSQPGNLVAGDIWIDNKNNRLYLYDGTDLTLVGPTYDAGQGKTGFESASQIDDRNITSTILKLFLGGVLVGIYSPREIIVPTQFAITGFHTWNEDTQTPKRQKLYKGFNIANVENETGINGFWWRGTSLNSKYLLDDQGNQKTSLNFLPADGNGETTGYITIKNSKGLTIGVGDRPFVNAKIFGSTTYLDMLESNADFGIRIKNAQYSNSFINAIYIDASEYKIKMFDGLGQFENLVSVPELDLYGNLTVAGSVSIAGSLSVSGDVTYVTSQDLKIIDKTIELAIGEQDQIGSNADVEGGGFKLRSNEGDKDFVWKLDTDVVDDTPVGSWTSNQNINLSESGANANPSYRINGEMVLSSSELHAGVTRATGLTQLGTLTELSIDNIYIDSVSITRINGAGLTIDPNGGSLSLSNNKISNLASPTANDEAANKEYVDRAVDGKEILLSLDINGLIVSGDPDYTPFYAATIQNVRTVLNYMIPVEESLPGQNVKIMATSIREITAVFPITVSEEETAVLQKSRVTVRNFDNTGTVAVVQDIVANPAYSGSTTNIEFTVDRFVYKFQSDGANWNSTGVDRIVA